MNKKKNWKDYVLLIIISIILFVMPKIKDLSPKFKIPIAEKELEIAMQESIMGQRSGGLSLFSDSFKRGYGDAVFGSDSNGIWLGAADFADAPFSVDMDGALNAKSATFTNEDNVTIIDAEGIVGANSFIPGSTAKANDQVLSGDAVFQDITGLGFTGLEFTKDTPVLVFGMIYYSRSGNDATLYTQISDGVDTYPDNTLWNHTPYAIDAQTSFSLFNFTHVITVPAGRTTLKIQCARSSPDETITVLGLQSFGRSTFGYLILGK